VTTLPDISVILRGLGIDTLPDSDDHLLVSAGFLRFLLSALAQSAPFDADFYVTRHPDVAAEIADGRCQSAHDHYCRHGFFEGRPAVPPTFDAVWYGERYPDLAGLGAAELRGHYERSGRAEARAGHAGEQTVEAWGDAVGLRAEPPADHDLAYATLADARVQVFGALFDGGPVLGDDRLSLRLRHRRYRRPVDRFARHAGYDHRLPGDWIYGGPAHTHFGHVMSEMIHRLLPSRRLFGAAGILFVGTEDEEAMTGFDSLPDFFQQILSYLAIDPDAVRILHRNHVVERLHIVEQGSDFGGGPKPGYLAELRAFSAPRLQELIAPCRRPGHPLAALLAARQIYVSRSAVVPSGGFLGESLLDAALAEAGFTIFRPEAHPVWVQLAVYRQARLVVFAEGSACHGTELLGTAMMRTCLLLSRRESHLDIFRGILAPRARVFGYLPCGPDIGTAAVHPETGEPLDNLGVSLVDPSSLSAFLRAWGASTPPVIDRARYAAAAEQDFTAYLDWHRWHSRLCDEPALDALQRNFAAAVKQIATG
jgi:hypothetical protein